MAEGVWRCAEASPSAKGKGVAAVRVRSKPVENSHRHSAIGGIEQPIGRVGRMRPVIRGNCRTAEKGYQYAGEKASRPRAGAAALLRSAGDDFVHGAVRRGWGVCQDDGIGEKRRVCEWKSRKTRLLFI